MPGVNMPGMCAADPYVALRLNRRYLMEAGTVIPLMGYPMLVAAIPTHPLEPPCLTKHWGTHKSVKEKC